MANLCTEAIDTHSEYVELETACDITLTVGNTYTIQCLYGEFYIRRGTTGKGFKVTAPMVFTMKHASAVDVYVKTGVNPATINIDESEEE